LVTTLRERTAEVFPPCEVLEFAGNRCILACPTIRLHPGTGEQPQLLAPVQVQSLLGVECRGKSSSRLLGEGCPQDENGRDGRSPMVRFIIEPTTTCHWAQVRFIFDATGGNIMVQGFRPGIGRRSRGHRAGIHRAEVPEVVGGGSPASPTIFNDLFSRKGCFQEKPIVYWDINWHRSNISYDPVAQR
jgi:hypothetical protein